jgi:2'-5' RNA ligase
MADHVHDPRQRYSYELRLDAALDAALRALAAQLEADGLLPAGAATAPRFQPHLTLLRGDRADPDVLAAVAAIVGATPELQLVRCGTFGSGRIAWLAPHDDRSIVCARTQLVEQLGTDHVDPLALARSPWVPHVTVAYAIDEPHRADALRHIEQVLPLDGRWQSAQCWDLAVRPTVLQHVAVVR